jgi:hypothetical protein
LEIYLESKSVPASFCPYINPRTPAQLFHPRNPIKVAHRAVADERLRRKPLIADARANQSFPHRSKATSEFP